MNDGGRSVRLANAYSEGSTRIPHNELYAAFERIFLEAFRDPPRREPGKEAITSDGYSYRLEETEREFFERIYAPSAPLRAGDLDESARAALDNPDPEEPIDRYAKDMLDFLFGADPWLVIKAPIGWGKSTLLRYVWLYLASQREWLSQHVVPVYISLDDYIGQLKELKDAASIRQVFVDDILNPRLIRLTKHLTGLDNEAFWQYLKSGTDPFSRLDEDENDLATTYGSGRARNRLREAVHRKRADSKAHPLFHRFATKYLIRHLGKTVVVILDNVDPLSMQVHEVMLEEAHSLATTFGAKVIVSVREDTYQRLVEDDKEIMRAHPPLRIDITRHDVDAFLRRRVEYARQAIQKRGPKEMRVTSYNKPVTFTEAVRVFDAMLETLLTDQCREALDKVACHNRQRISSLLLTYLSSGYVDQDRLVEKILGRLSGGDPTPDSPLWILLASIVTANHTTRACSSWLRGQAGDVVNLYANGTLETNHLTVNTQVLCYFKRHPEQPTLAALQHDYCSLFDRGLQQGAERSVTYAAKNLLNNDLLSSPQLFRVSGRKEIDASSLQLSITESGEYYLNVFRNYFEYLVYMKDEADLGHNTHRIRDCVQVTGSRERFGEVRKFLEHLFEQEENFLDHLDANQRRRLRDHFSSPGDDGPFVVAVPIDRMIEYGQRRRLGADDLEALWALQTKIRRYVASYW